MKLSDLDYDISRRTVHRDLIKLSEIYPIFCVNEEQKENQWAWRKDIGLMDLHNMCPLPINGQFISICVVKAREKGFCRQQ